ncbi:MAG: CRISPR system precrRNA processing endoribonuclease RAMP protein Cas6 [Chloracidobacterium sp.]|uniref:CRISPR system precrRNA processing endoribonuclease RAMP protein Cas6 n=1 Tax=Chloracidobacterium validum TaxID=2821543 RepID=A0ABX8BBL1_9BACT|nr:CRISPR system precrRNA processing endoribonuclease RAMP protein Cas6 [Chloracidobacterium validum]QUW04051.1 CRISPR system precrRNA processing endoribonuclease RAMP protein Cas6 [Chloracidobacterium validum]
MATMAQMTLPAIAIGRYGFTLRPQGPAVLPDYPGPMLRGAFGQALKRVVCVVEHRDCSRCIVQARCHYPYIFETSPPKPLPTLPGLTDAPVPFVLDVCPTSYTPRPTPDAPLRFGLTVIGVRANQGLKYVIEAVSEMARAGLGRDRVRFRLTEVQPLDAAGGPAAGVRPLAELVAARVAALTPMGRVRVRFESPTRIRVRGDLQADITFGVLARNLLRRLVLLSEVHGDGHPAWDVRLALAAADAVQTEHRRLRWLDWARWSSRQQQRLRLGGLLGEVVFGGGDLGWFATLLAVGEHLHIGTGTSMGLGRMRVERLDAGSATEASA